MTDIGRPEPPERGLFARIAVDIRPLRESRDFRRLWFGVGISAIGSQITTVAIPFQPAARAFSGSSTRRRSLERSSPR